MKKITTFLFSFMLFSFATNAQTVLFSEDFEGQDAASNLSVGELGTSNVYDLATTYSSTPVSAPTNGGSYCAKIAVNTSAGEVSAVGLFPNGGSFTPPYTLSFDAWMNYSGADSTTEFIYFGVQHAGTTMLPTDGVDFAITADNGSSRDLRVYDAGAEVNFSNCDTCYPIGLSSGNGQNTGSAGSISTEYAAFLAPGSTDPANQWVHYSVVVTDTDVTFMVNGGAWGHYDVSNTSAGNILVGYMDLFGSSISNSDSFILIDNIEVVDNSSGSVSEGQIEGLKMYPNPANDILHIQAANSIDQVVIYNVYGQEILKINKPETVINIRDLKPGSYFVKVMSGDKNQTYQLIKK